MKESANSPLIAQLNDKEFYASFLLESFGKPLSFLNALEFFQKNSNDDLKEEAFLKYAEGTVSFSMPTPRVVYHNAVKAKQRMIARISERPAAEFAELLKQPCNACLDEIKEAFSFLQFLFGELAPLPLQEKYEPEVLEPPYTIDRLLSNLIPHRCSFHPPRCSDSFVTGEESWEDLQNSFAYFLQAFKDADAQEESPLKKLKIRYLLERFEYFDEDYHDENSEEDWYQNLPWTRPYYHFRDVLLRRAENPDYEIPESLKSCWDTEAAFEYLSEKFHNLTNGWDPDFQINEAFTFISRLQRNINNVIRPITCNYRQFFYFCENFDFPGSEKIKMFSGLHSVLIESLHYLRNYPDEDATLGEIGDFLSLKRPNLNRDDAGFLQKEILNYVSILNSELTDRLKKNVLEIINSSDTITCKAQLLSAIRKMISSLDCNSEDDITKLIDNFHEQNNLPVPDQHADFSGTIEQIYELNRMEKEQQQYEISKRDAEIRRRVLFEMSHSIKNMIVSVTTPLNDVLKDIQDDMIRYDISNAIRCAGMIRELALLGDMSMRNNEDWRKEWNTAEGKPLAKIVYEALYYAVNNMFDGTYFERFNSNYFNDLPDDEYDRVKEAFSDSETLEQLLANLNQYMLKCELDFPESIRNIRVSDKNRTGTQFLVLLQEMLLNAVKYSSFVPRSQRSMRIKLSGDEKTFSMGVCNSADAKLAAALNPSGIGHIMIANFARQFDAGFESGFCNGTYKVNLDFQL